MEVSILKKIIAILLCAVTLFAPALTSVCCADKQSELVVGSTTPMTGSFATDAWSLNSSDMDVRELIHGYELAGWSSAKSTFIMNSTVVKSITGGPDTYTITLKDGLKWSDGSAVTAWDYAFSILLNSSPEIAELGGSTGTFSRIQGVDAYSNGKAEAISGVTVSGNSTLKITLTKDYQPFFFDMGVFNIKPYPIGEIAPDCKVKSGNKGVYIDGEFTAELLKKNLLDPNTGYAAHPKVVSGPYKLVSYDAKENKATFEINEYFKGDMKGKKPSIEKIVFRYVPSDKVTDEVKNGKVDLMNRVTAKESIDALRKESSLKSSAYPRSGLAFISFCCEQTAVSTKEVRQAISYCFDKAAFAKEIVGNYGEVPYGFYGKGQWMVMLINGDMTAPAGMTTAEKNQLDSLELSSIKHYDFSIKQAEKILDKEGWKLGKDGIRSKKIDGKTVKLELVLAYPKGSQAGDVFPKTFVDNLEKVGIKLSLKELDPDELFRQYYRQEDRDCDMFFLATNFNTVYDPAENYALDDAHQVVYNRTALKDRTTYNLALDMRRTEPGDPIGYCAKWVKFQNQLMTQAPIIPAYTNEYYDFYVSGLKNYNITSYQTWSKAIVAATLD